MSININSYMNFKYLNSKLLEKYNGLIPVEIKCSFKKYNGVDYDFYTSNTIVYLKKNSSLLKIYKEKCICKDIGGVLFIDFDYNYEEYIALKKQAIFRFRDDVVDLPTSTYLSQSNFYVNGLLVEGNVATNYELYKNLEEIVREIFMLSVDKKEKILKYYNDIKHKIFKEESLTKEEYDLVCNLLDRDFDEKCEDLSVLKLSL